MPRLLLGRWAGATSMFPGVFCLALGLVPACETKKPAYHAVPFATDPAAQGMPAGSLVTTNNGDDTLSIILGGATTALSLPVGFIPVELEGPHHLSVDPAGAFLYVNLSEAVIGSGGGPHGAHGTGTIPGYVLKLDTRTGRLTAQVNVDPNPGDNVLSPDGRSLYVTHYDLLTWTKGAQMGDFRQGDSHLVVIDTATMTVRQRVPLCPAAHGVRLSRDGSMLFATCGPDEMAVATIANLATSVSRVPLPGTEEGANCSRCPYAVGVAPDDTVWMFNLGQSGGTQGRGSLNIYDPKNPQGTFDPVRTATFCGSPVFGAFAGDATGYLAYVPEQGRCGDWVRIYSPGAAGQPPVEVGTIALGADQCINAHMLVIAGDGKTGYLACEGDHTRPGSLVTLDLAGRTVLRSVATGIFTDGVVIVPPRLPEAEAP